MADDERVLVALQESASTGVRVVGLRVLHYGIGFVASVLIARALGPSGRGLYAFPIAFLGIVMALSHLGLEHANVYLAARKVPLRDLWAADAAGAVLVSLVAFALVALLRVVIGPAFFAGLPGSWLIVTISQLPVLLVSLYWAGLMQLAGRLRLAVTATLVGTALQAFVVIVLATQGALTPFRILALGWLPTIATCLVLLWAGARVGIAGSRVEAPLLRRAVGFGLKAYVATIFTFLLFRLDQVLVEHRLGFEELGLYSLAVVLAEILWLATDPFAASVLPHQVRSAGDDGRRLGFATARLALIVALGAGAVAWIVAPYAIRIAYGDAFAGAVWPFRLLLPGVAALALQRPLGPVLMTEGRLALIATMNAGALILNVALNLLLLPRIGVEGASVASSITYGALAIAYVMAVRRPGVSGFGDLVPRRSDLASLGRAFRLRPPARGVRAPGPPRVVLVIGTLDRGGTEGQVVTLARGLLARGWQVTVLCLSSEGSLANVVRDAGGEVLVGGFRGLTPILNPMPLIRVFRRIREQVRSRDPDVVHAFLYWGSLIGTWVGHSLEVPAVVVSQRSLRNSSGAKAILRPWERRSIRHADAWLCNSLAVGADALAHGTPASKIHVIHNGIDPGPEPAAAMATGERPRILVVANLIAYKGHHVLLEAFASVLGRLGPDAAELRLAGSGPEEQTLREEAARLGVGGRVRFLGSIADVRSELDASCFTVLSSLSEGMPNAVLESMAAGRAVVATDVGGVREALEEGGGVIVPAANPQALAEQMARLLRDPELAGRLGADGRRNVVRRYGVDRMVDETLGIYEDVVGRRTASAGAAEHA